MWECLEEDAPLCGNCLDGILSTICWGPWSHCLSTGQQLGRKAVCWGNELETQQRRVRTIWSPLSSADTTCKHDGLPGNNGFCLKSAFQILHRLLSWPTLTHNPYRGKCTGKHNSKRKELTEYLNYLSPLISLAFIC